MLAAADKLALGGTFSARWRPDLGVAAADAALSAADASGLGSSRRGRGGFISCIDAGEGAPGRFPHG